MSAFLKHAHALALAALCVAGLAITPGCEREVLDIDTPGGGMEINKNPITDETSIELKNEDDGPLD